MEEIKLYGAMMRISSMGMSFYVITYISNDLSKVNQYAKEYAENHPLYELKVTEIELDKVLAVSSTNYF